MKIGNEKMRSTPSLSRSSFDLKDFFSLKKRFTPLNALLSRADESGLNDAQKNRQYTDS
jgi:hypothetical protein